MLRAPLSGEPSPGRASTHGARGGRMSVDDRAGAGRPGADAERPRDIPSRGWRQIVRRAWKEAKADHVPLLAAGVAFFGFLALFPAIIAVATVYGMVASKGDIASQVDQLGSSVPASARQLLVDQLRQVASSSHGALTIGLVVSLLLALWSASSGTMNLMKAVNIAYDEDETRGMLKLRGTALA